MGEDIKTVIIHRADNALGLFFGGQVEFVVNSTDSQIKLFENAVRQIRLNRISMILQRGEMAYP